MKITNYLDHLKIKQYFRKKENTRSLIIIVISCVLIVLLIVLLYKNVFKKSNKTDDKKKDNSLPIIKSKKDIPLLKRPYMNVYDDKGKRVNVVMVEFIMSKEEKEFHDKNKDKLLFLGISSYLEFPNPVVNKHDPYSDPKHEAWKFNYKEMFPAWLYCFRN